MKITVAGAGGVGAYFGAVLQRSGHSVHFLVRERHAEAIGTRGIQVISGDAPPWQIMPAGVSVKASDIGESDVVILATKAFQVSDMAAGLAPLLHASTPILPLQNGISVTDTLAQALGKQHVLGGVCVIISRLLEPGRVQHLGGQPAIAFGELDGSRSPRCEALADALSDAGVTATISGTIYHDMWRKFMLIASYGGVGALTRQPVGKTRAFPLTRQLVQEAMLEVKTLANVSGIALTSEGVEWAMGQFDASTPDSTASMQRDLAAGRKSELEDQNGTICRLAAEAGIAVPVHSTIYRSMALLENLLT